MTTSRASAACLLCGAVLFAGSRVCAAIFWRTGGIAEQSLSELGAKSVYTTGVTLNGAPGTLTAHAVPATASSTAATLARRLGLPRDASLGGTLITHAEKGRLYRFFILPSGASEASCLVLTFEQSVRDMAHARSAPVAWPEGVPALAAQPSFAAVCEATRTTFVTADTAETPDAAVQHAAQVLLSAGWKPACPFSPALGAFVSGRSVCLLFARADPLTSRTSISLLQREGAAR